MPYVLAILGPANGPIYKGTTYLKSFDPDGRDVYPTGNADFTDKIEDAMKFDSFNEALDLWKKQSKTVPLRPDGKPNRPLTGFHVSVEKVP